MAAAVGFPSRDLVSIGEMVGLAFPALSVAAVDQPLLGSTRALPHSAVVVAVLAPFGAFGTAGPVSRGKRVSAAASLTSADS